MKSNGLQKRMKVVALFLPEIKELIAAKNFNSLKSILKNINPMDLAEGWNQLESTEKIIVFKLLGTRRAVELFESLAFEEQTRVINNLDNQEVAAVINEMAPDERADLFKELPEKAYKKLLLLINKEEARDIKELMTYAEDTAGALMTTEMVEIRPSMSARQALLWVQENLRADYRENIYSIFATDENHKLLGSVSLQALLKAPPDMLVKDIMTASDLIKVSDKTSNEEVGKLFQHYDLLDAPVVDEENELLGIITVDDIVEFMEKETTAEMYEIGKMSAEGGEIIRYARANTFELVRRRVGWLILLLMFDFLTGTVLKNFEATLSTVVALTFFIPMLLDTGGNAGAQTSITIIRGLATGDVDFKNVGKVIKLEFSAALLMSGIIGTFAFLRAFWLQGDFSLALVVGLSMITIALLAIATGVFLPLFSKKIGLDPAVLAGPITTSVIDIVGLIIYFKIAQAFIPALQVIK